MKRILLLFILCLSSFCTKNYAEHKKVFTDFCSYLQDADIEKLKQVSTEITVALICSYFDHHRGTKNGFADIMNVNIESGTSNMQSNIRIVRDSVSNDNLSSWIWFTVNESQVLYIVELVKVAGEWKVDLPLMN